MHLDLSERTVEAHLVIDVNGEVDVHSAPQLSDRLSQAIDSGPNSLVVDMSSLAFIDSTGLGALVAARNHANSTGVSLRLVCSSSRLLKVFRITGLHQVFEIFPTLEQAVRIDTLPTGGS